VVWVLIAWHEEVLGSGFWLRGARRSWVLGSDCTARGGLGFWVSGCAAGKGYAGSGCMV